MNPAELPGPVRIPLLGQLPQFLRNPPHLVLQHLAQRHGSVFQYSLGAQRIVCIAEPELIKAILKGRPHCFRRSIALANAIEGTGFQGVFTAEAERWQRQRRQVMRGLRPQVVHAAQAHISAVVQSLADKWRAQPPGQPDIVSDLKRAASEIVIATSLGIKPGDSLTQDPALQAAIERWFRAIGLRARLPRKLYQLINAWNGRADDHASELLRATAEQAVLAARARLAGDYSAPQNILEGLIAAQHENEDTINDEEIVGNAVTMILAGQETTASSMTWLLFYLAKHPELVERLREKLDEVLLDDSHPIDRTVFEKVPQLQQLCLEVLRLRPTAPLFGLTANHDVSIAGLKIPAGHKVVLLAREKVNDATDVPVLSWDDHEAPTGRPTPNDTTEGFAFGAGPRLCPGRYLALVEMMTMTIMVVRQFDVRLATPEQDIKEDFTFAMHPKNLRFELRPRQSGRPQL